MADKIEVEMKFRVIDHTEIEKQFTYWSDQRIEIDTYYTHPLKDLLTADQWLRVRKVDIGNSKFYHLTFKGPLLDSDSKSRHEIDLETQIDPTSFLEALGYTELIQVRKRRRISCPQPWVWPFPEVCLDEVEGLGNFVEIEALGVIQEKEACIAHIKALADKLGLVEQEKVGYARLALQLSQSKRCS